MLSGILVRERDGGEDDTSVIRQIDRMDGSFYFSIFNNNCYF
jgi:hypothetical protein